MKLNHRSYLYVPATRLDRIEKAFAAGADAVIVDWEDAVAAEQKAEVRLRTAEYLSTHTHQVWLRINAADSPEHTKDLAVLSSLNQLAGIFLPKAQSQAEIEQVAHVSGCPIVAIIETAAGILNLASMAKANGLVAFSFGCLDLANQLGMKPQSAAAEMMMDKLRMDLLLHSIAAGINPPIDTVYPKLNDDVGLRTQASKSRNLGLVGMMCIHPQQIAPLHETLQPTEAELSFAQRIREQYQNGAGAAFQLDGQMVDMPVILHALALCERWGV